MDRRDFLKASLAAGAAVGLSPGLLGWIPSHNWEEYDFGSGPEVKDRLYQGPFPQYAPENFFGGMVIQYTTPGKQTINCFGSGLMAYVSGDLGAPHVPGESLETTIDKIFRVPYATKVYIRPNWRHIQKRSGRLEPDDYWKITMDKAAQYGKRVGFRIMMNNPDIAENALPEFLCRKVKFTQLPGDWKTGPYAFRAHEDHRQPQYDDPYFIEAFTEMHQLLAEQYNGSPLIEFMDTCIYGFWGEGHTWPYEGNNFESDRKAEETFLQLFDIQNACWDKVPLLTNTQPDFSRVGNSAVVDRTIRTHNWLRTDTVYVENEQIEAISNRPAWTGAAVDLSFPNGAGAKSVESEEDITRIEAGISHVRDLGPNYFSLWPFHNVNADSLMQYYRRSSAGLDGMAASIGFRVRPSWIWVPEDESLGNHMIFGMVNDGIAGVPGVLRLTLFTDDGKVNVSGCLDPGYPKPQGVRQAMMTLPEGVDWNSGALKLKAELEVKGVRYPVPFACAQKLTPEGSLTIKATMNS